MSKQTVSEFVQLAFAIVGDQKWYADTKYGYIRNEDYECPICAVTNEITGICFANTEVVSAAKRIGLSTDIVCSIVEAADGSQGVTRNMLIAALVNKS